MEKHNDKTGLDRSIVKIKVIMLLKSVESMPHYSLPKRYSFRYYRDGYRKSWAKIQVNVNHFETLEEACNRFDRDFGESIDNIKDRMIFVLDEEGRKVATATMWFTLVSGHLINRVHWVEVEPPHQGKQISHAMMTELLTQFSPSGPIYLTTQTWSYRAISIYFKFGFLPFPYKQIDSYFTSSYDHNVDMAFENEEIKKAWNLIYTKINKKTLEKQNQ